MRRSALLLLVAAAAAGCAREPVTRPATDRTAGPEATSSGTCGKPGAGLRLTLTAEPARPGDRVRSVELLLEGPPASTLGVRFTGVGAVEMLPGDESSRVRIGENGRAAIRVSISWPEGTAEPGMVVAHVTTEDGRTQEARLLVSEGGGGGVAKPSAVRGATVNGRVVRIAPSG